MRLASRLAWGLVLAACSLQVFSAQDLSPRAYVITPVNSNAINLTYSFYDGSLLFNGLIPVTGATGKYSVPIVSYYRAFSFFGRSANLIGVFAYGVGNFQGTVLTHEQQIYRSGLVDSAFRFSVNLKGGPAMPAHEYVKWRQKTLMGVSLKMLVPAGQYDPARVVNWGINRWAFKPEFGYSERWRSWVLDGYAGIWFYTTNSKFFDLPAPRPQTEEPVGSFEGHLSYDLKPRLWFSLDGNFWFGGLASISGVPNPDSRQTSSRIGVTAAVPVSKHQSLKVSYSNGTYVRFGGNYQNVSFSWQYSWVDKPK